MTYATKRLIYGGAQYNIYGGNYGFERYYHLHATDDHVNDLYLTDRSG